MIKDKFPKLIVNYFDKIPRFINSTVYPALKNVKPWNIIKNNRACLQTRYLGNMKCL
jgi:hypothetical protein